MPLDIDLGGGGNGLDINLPTTGLLKVPRWRDASEWDGRALPADTVGRGVQSKAYADVNLLIVESGRTVDISQRDTDLTARGTNAASEASSARTALTTSGHFVYHGVINSTDSTGVGTLVQHGPTTFASFGYRIYCDSGNILLEWDSSNYSTQIDNVIDLSNPDEFIISFTVRTNPDTTGATDAVLVELQAYNVTDGTYHRAPLATGGSFASSGSDTLMVAGRWDGASTDREMDNLPIAVRIGTAPRSFAAVLEDFDTPRTASTFDEWDQWRPGPMLPAALAADGEWFGPQPGVAASATQHVRRRCMGAIHQHLWPSTASLILADDFGTSASVMTGQLSLIPNSTRYVLVLPTLVQLFPHQLATRVRGRVWIYAADGSGGGSPPVPEIAVRLVCMDRLPAAPGAIWKSGPATIASIANNTGEWLDLEPVEIVRGKGLGLAGYVGSANIGLAFAIDPDDLTSGAEESGWGWRIRALISWQYVGDNDGAEDFPLSPGYGGGGFGGDQI